VFILLGFEVLSSENLINELETKGPNAQLKGIVATVAAMETNMSRKCNEKAQKLRYTIYFIRH